MSEGASEGKRPAEPDDIICAVASTSTSLVMIGIGVAGAARLARGNPVTLDLRPYGVRCRIVLFGAPTADQAKAIIESAAGRAMAEWAEAKDAGKGAP